LSIEIKPDDIEVNSVLVYGSDVDSWKAENRYALSARKRILDIVVATLLLLLTSPVLLIALFLNVFFTGGRPVYVQKRLGFGGREFSLIKLRTMRMPKNHEKWNKLTELNDPRITGWGKFLRKSYIDELLQMINVVIGHMSVIGPRPETRTLSDEIISKHRRFKDRVSVRPGVTGLAQVYFRKPATEDDLWRKYYYDRLYIADCGFMLDVKLLLQTVVRVVRLRGW